MDLMEQCRIWHGNEAYQDIIDAIEALPEEGRTPDLACELARAYNNSAPQKGRQCYEKAVELLKPHEELFSEGHSWNFRMAFAYYYLDQEQLALRYFEKALEARPDDGDTREFIDDCRRRLAFPRFEKPFRQRAAECWTLFAQNEAELRRLLDARDGRDASEALVAKCRELLSHAFADVNFELGFNGRKYELILSPEGDQAALFALAYFCRRAPRAVLERWNILAGRQPSSGFRLCVSDFQEGVCAGDVRVWAEKKGEAPENVKAALTLYCEKLLPLLQESEDAVWWMLSLLTDQAIGEIPAMAYIEGFTVAAAPKPGPSISLEALPEALEAMGCALCLDPDHYLDNGYTAYEMKPDEDPDADWRLDVFAGVTRCPALVNEYLAGQSGAMDRFHQDGAVPGFLCYPLDCFAGEAERGKAVLDFRDGLEAYLLKTAGADAVTFLGGASGIYCGYLDFIAWDLPPVLDAAVDFFESSPVAWADFHTFRRDASTVRLKEGPSGGA